jgi:cbb3-type cytochrome oxidase subunit 3
MFFQIKNLDYDATGCDTDSGKEKIKSSLGLYDKLMIGLSVTLAILAIYPIFKLVMNIIGKVFSGGLAGSIVEIIIGIFELAVIIGLLTFMIIILINLRKISSDNPCGDKTLLIEKLNYIYNLVKYAFFVSLALSIIMIAVAVGYFIYAYRKKKKQEQEEYEEYLYEQQTQEPQVQENNQTLVKESTTQPTVQVDKTQSKVTTT